MITNLILLGLFIIVLGVHLYQNNKLKKAIKLKEDGFEKYKQAVEENRKARDGYVKELERGNSLLTSHLEIKTKVLSDKEKEINKYFSICDKFVCHVEMLQNNNQILRNKIRSKMMLEKYNKNVFNAINTSYDRLRDENQFLNKVVKTNKPLDRIKKLEMALIDINEIMIDGFWDDNIDKDCNKVIKIIQKLNNFKKKK